MRHFRRRFGSISFNAQLALYHAFAHELIFLGQIYFYCTDFWFLNIFSKNLVSLRLDGEVESGDDDNGAEEDEPAGNGQKGLLEN